MIEASNAFQRSGEYEFKGRKLEPYSHLRQSAALAMGIRYYTLSQDDLRTIKNPEPKEGEPDEVQVYDGLIHDAAILLWLCSQSDEQCRAARRRPLELEAEVDKWADKEGITLGAPSLAEATGLFIRIVSDANEARPQPQEGQGDTEDDQEGNA